MKKIETRNDLIQTFGKQLIICEIGVFKGEFSKILFETLNPKELHLIDIFEGDAGSGDKDGNNMSFTNLEKEYHNLKEYFNKNSNVFLHKGKSYDILEKFDNNYFDIIYIDGDHTYDGVKLDLQISYEKVKNGGYICGHDYTTRFEGVIRAVNEFCSEKNLIIDSITKDGCPSFLIINNK